jgi:hypothetical protein
VHVLLDSEERPRQRKRLLEQRRNQAIREQSKASSVAPSVTQLEHYLALNQEERHKETQEEYNSKYNWERTTAMWKHIPHVSTRAASTNWLVKLLERDWHIDATQLSSLDALINFLEQVTDLPNKEERQAIARTVRLCVTFVAYLLTEAPSTAWCTLRYSGGQVRQMSVPICFPPYSLHLLKIFSSRACDEPHRLEEYLLHNVIQSMEDPTLHLRVIDGNFCIESGSGDLSTHKWPLDWEEKARARRKPCRELLSSPTGGNLPSVLATLCLDYLSLGSLVEPFFF